MQHLEGSGTPVLYIGRTVLKGELRVMQILLYCAKSDSIIIMNSDNKTNKSTNVKNYIFFAHKLSYRRHVSTYLDRLRLLNVSKAHTKHAQQHYYKRILCYVQTLYAHVLINLVFELCFIGGHAVAQLVEALRYKPEGHGFDFRWCHCNFLLK